MTEPTHTTGPWTVEHLDDVTPGFVAVCGALPVGCRVPYRTDVVAWVVHPYPRSGSIEANSHLIAAAPDLLDAILKSDAAHWTPAMRAAIRKATEIPLTPQQR